MYGLNIDPGNPEGNPGTTELRDLGVEQVRYTYRDLSPGNQLDPNQVRFYTQKLETLNRAEIGSLIILSYETTPNKPAPDAPDANWDGYIDNFVQRVGQIAQILAPWRPTFQIWNEPDLPPNPGYDPTLREAVFGRMLLRAVEAIKAVDSSLAVIGGGLASGQPPWLQNVLDSTGGSLPLDGIALHPYGKRPEPNWPEPDWGYGYIGDTIAGYRQVGPWPIWISEIGTHTLDDQGQAEYLRRFYRRITNYFSDTVEQVFWFCYSDRMVYPYGLLDQAGRPKLAYQAYRDTAPRRPPLDDDLSADALAELHNFARYFEQRLVFGGRDSTLEAQMLQELRGNPQELTQPQIRQITEHLLVGSDFVVSTPEIEALHALQQQKDLYDVLKAIVLATHQRTGALTGRLGIHTRIAAENDHNAEVNLEASLQIARHVQPGNRLIIMDTVKAVPDDDKLLAPDVFETDTYGHLRNGLIDNHAWNLHKLVRAIRDRGFQDQVWLFVRIDGPDNGASINVFDADSRRKYELAIAKLIRYLETTLPDTPFKIILGNEPDLPFERQWSDPHVDSRIFTLDQYAPVVGPYLKRIASQRPDVTFIAPALSGLLKHDHLPFFQALFGDDRPENFIPSIHGYAGDVDALDGDRKNFIELEVEKLRVLAGFRHISGTEIGSSNPFPSAIWLNDHGRFDDVVIWLMLSVDYQEHSAPNNHWNFRIDHAADDPTARYLGDIINATKIIVLRNIRERGGRGLQIMKPHAGTLPAYGVDYVSHNTPTSALIGQTNGVQVTIRNGSYRTWSAGGANPVRLGYHWYTTEGQEVAPGLWDDNRAPLPHDLQPGQSVTLNPNLSIPRTPGTYELRWDIVEEMVTWFAWQGVPTLNVQVTVNTEQVDPVPSGLNVTASHNNRSQGRDNISQALDDNVYTRWSTLQPQGPGMWFQIDLGQIQAIKRVHLVSDRSPRDYPRGYIVALSTDQTAWTTVAEKQNNDGPLDVAFAPQEARYIRVEQTGNDPIFWWSIHEIEVSTELRLTVTSSHNNVTTGADNLRQAIDDRPQTRWSSRSGQRPGMWIEVNLNETRSVNGLILDSSNSPQDYPRGYVVSTSVDRVEWEEVARRDQNSQALDVNFPAREAHYIRVEQTGSSDRWWWSIHEIIVRSDDDDIPAEDQGSDEVWVTAQSSHNNVEEGPDNLLQALDGQAETRWSSRAPLQPGMWFEFDLNTVRTLKSLMIDNAASPQDYPRGYVVKTSLDRSQWDEAARRDQNDQALTVSFTPRQVRYIRVEQTGHSDRWWWSIHRVAFGIVD